MELYIVKDLVILESLEDSWANYKKALQNNGRPRRPSPCLGVDLQFPFMVKPVVQSKSSHECVGKLRDVVNWNYEQADAEFYLDEDYLIGSIIFNISSNIEGFSSIFEKPDDNNFKISMNLSLCHLPTTNTPVPPPESLITLSEEMSFDFDHDFDLYGFCIREKARMEEILKLWDHETGYIHAKLTVKILLNQVAVRTVKREKEPAEDFNEIGVMSRKMLEEEICTDLEIRCGDGGVVKCHRAVLGGRSKVFQSKFQAEEMDEARTGKLVMEGMSEQGVRAFLRWIYWKDVKEALSESNVAVELLIAGDKYDLEGLVYNMKEIVFERRGCDEAWFSLESGVRLYRWARNLEGLKKFKEKAVGVLKFLGKSYPGKLMESEEYQELIKNDAEAVVELIMKN